MASNKTLAKNIITRYPGADRTEVLKLLQQAVQAGRADERNIILTILNDHRRIMREALQSVDSENRLERLKIVRSIKTIDALIALL